MANINFVGDISIFRKYEEIKKDPLQELELPVADYSIGNMEFIIPNGRRKLFYDIPDNYKVSFEYFKSLKLDRFNAYGFANNHSMDYGIMGFKDMKEVLISRGVSVFGFGKNSEYNILKFSVKGIKFGVIAFVKDGRWTNTNTDEGPNLYDTNAVIREISGLKEKCDHIIVFPHWGTELIDSPNQKDIINARRFIDSGASAVLGHHPHIIQGIEEYGKGVIAYSLGSFIYIPEEELGFSKRQGDNRNYSICLNIEFDKDKIKKLSTFFYKLNSKSHIPILEMSEQNISYFKFVNSKIGDVQYYKRQIKNSLIEREIRSMILRARMSPMKTLLHYSNYLTTKLSRIFKVNR